MTIRTYSNQLISRWQSALYKVLDQGTLEQEEKPFDALGSDHPAMAATCEACDELQRAMGGTDHHIEQSGLPNERYAEPVEMTDLIKECARLYVGLLGARMMGNQEKITELENELRFSVCDPMWAKALLEFHKGDDNQIPYRRYESMDDFVIPLPNQKAVKVAFVSDWATGTAIAHNIMRCIGENKPDVLIHLGDIYYSGTRKEAEENFLNVVRTYIPETVPVFTLAGNHDLYDGGEGYYWLIDQLGQPASYFCLRNEHWQILAIGAPTENDNPTDILESVPPIDSHELLWHYHKINNNQGRKTVMLSHYQLFTASGNIARSQDKRPLAINPVLYSAFKEYLDQIDLWLWGHEHNFIVFEPYLELKRGRCIGSGALPVPLLWQPYRTLPDLVWPDYIGGPPRMNLHARLGHDGDHYHHGYGILTLNGSQGEMNYYQVAGTQGGAEIVFREEI